MIANGFRGAMWCPIFLNLHLSKLFPFCASESFRWKFPRGLGLGRIAREYLDKQQLSLMMPGCNMLQHAVQVSGQKPRNPNLLISDSHFKLACMESLHDKHTHTTLRSFTFSTAEPNLWKMNMMKKKNKMMMMMMTTTSLMTTMTMMLEMELIWNKMTVTFIQKILHRTCERHQCSNLIIYGDLDLKPSHTRELGSYLHACTDMWHVSLKCRTQKHPEVFTSML